MKTNLPLREQWRLQHTEEWNISHNTCSVLGENKIRKYDYYFFLEKYIVYINLLAPEFYT